MARGQLFGPQRHTARRLIVLGDLQPSFACLNHRHALFVPVQADQSVVFQRSGQLQRCSRHGRGTARPPRIAEHYRENRGCYGKGSNCHPDPATMFSIGRNARGPQPELRGFLLIGKVWWLVDRTCFGNRSGHRSGVRRDSRRRLLSQRGTEELHGRGRRADRRSLPCRCRDVLRCLLVNGCSLVNNGHARRSIGRDQPKGVLNGLVRRPVRIHRLV